MATEGDLLAHQQLTRGSGMALALYVGAGPAIGTHEGPALPSPIIKRQLAMP